ncbi:hypothetical protein BS47DRAFT_1293515 [Hydnum rufescens UP504]|uniref:Uncharacterized protein n=1 Tax=Hydnum rufescens UP504 TaxID=1448309 RepID=A0A9P6DY88_9AGAM|nr:hypothetical protein BS47DRAFT_1293515 [Hydnum rufescens UP504]
MLSENDVPDLSTGPGKSRRKEPFPRGKRQGSALRPPGGVPSGIQTLHFTQKRPGNRSFAPVNNNGGNRTRPKPLYVNPKPSSRLTCPPAPFEVPKLQSTPTPAGPVFVRLSKSWANSLNPGPVWQLMEDLGWYKELVDTPDGGRTRPVVYDKLKFPGDDLEVLNRDAAMPYLPSDKVTNPDGSLRPSPPVDCLFGPFEDQKSVKLSIFEHLKLVNIVPHSNSHVFNAGGPVWGLDWCPVNDIALKQRDFVQYLAVSTFPTSAYSPIISSKVTRPFPACIQIWSYGPDSQGSEPDPEGANGIVKCGMAVCIESGPAMEIKWCPLPSHDMKEPDHELSKLGILAGVFGDGSVSVYAIPDPTCLRKRGMVNADGPLFVRLAQPLVRIELDGAACTCLDWANSEIIAVACSNGQRAYFIRSPSDDVHSFISLDVLPLNCISVAQVAIRSIAWVRTPPANVEGEEDATKDPTIIASTAYDGSLHLTDTRDPFGHPIFRARDISYGVAFGPYSGGPLAAEHENLLKCYSMMPASLGRGHGTSETKGPVWNISISDYHPYIATAAADGSCMTSNLLKGLRKGGAVPVLTYKIYQMDYNRKTGQYRMLDNLLPIELKDRSSVTRNVKAKKAKGRQRDGSGAWPYEVGVHRVAWNSGAGIGCSPLLASGMACGFCRIDWVRGRFFQDRVPYGDIESLRGENGGVDDFLEEDDEDEEV